MHKYSAVVYVSLELLSDESYDMSQRRILGIFKISGEVSKFYENVKECITVVCATSSTNTLHYVLICRDTINILKLFM